MSYQTTLSFDLLDILQLESHMKTNSVRLASILNGMVYDSGDRNLTVLSTEQFTQDDITDVLSSINAYTNPEVPKEQVKTNLGLQHTTVNTTTFKTVYVHDYVYNNNWNLIKLVVNSFSSDVSYTVRLVDVSNNTVLGSGTFSNINSQDSEISLGVTETNCKLEIQAKVNVQGNVTLMGCSLIVETV